MSVDLPTDITTNNTIDTSKPAVAKAALSAHDYLLRRGGDGV